MFLFGFFIYFFVEIMVKVFCNEILVGVFLLRFWFGILIDVYLFYLVFGLGFLRAILVKVFFAILLVYIFYSLFYFYFSVNLLCLFLVSSKILKYEDVEFIKLFVNKTKIANKAKFLNKINNSIIQVNKKWKFSPN